MTNLEIIKYLATNNPTRLAELLDDVWCCAWNFGANTQRTGEYDEESDIEFSDSKWLEQEATANLFFGKSELEQWSKAINNPSIEITYPDNLVIKLPFEGKDPSHMWNTDNNFNIINKAIDELKLLDAIMETEKYSNDTYANFRKDVCDNCLCTECLQSQMDIVECPEFDNYMES